MPILGSAIKGAIKENLFHQPTFAEKVQQRLSIVGDSINGLFEEVKPRDEEANTPVGKCVQRVYDEASAQASKISSELQSCYQKEGGTTFDGLKDHAAEIKDKVAAKVGQASKDMASGKESLTEKAKEFMAEHNPLKTKEQTTMDKLSEGAQMVSEFIHEKNPFAKPGETTFEKLKRQASETFEGFGLPSLARENITSAAGSKSWLGMGKNEPEESSLLGRLGRDFMISTTLLALFAAAVIYLLSDRRRMSKLKNQAKPYVAKAKETTQEAIDLVKETKDDAVNFVNRKVHQVQSEFERAQAEVKAQKATQQPGYTSTAPQSKASNVDQLIDELREDAEEKLKQKGQTPTNAEADIRVKVHGTPKSHLQ